MMGNVYANRYAAQIFAILSPLIGELMAKGAIRSQCNRLGITEDGIEKQHIPVLAEGVKKAMTVFVGSEGASQIEKRIRLI